MPIDEAVQHPTSTPLAQATVTAKHAGEGIHRTSQGRTGTFGTDDARDSADSVEHTVRVSQQEPDRAPPAQLALPVDDDLSAAMCALEEILLALIDLVDDARHAAHTAGRLAAAVDPDRSEAVQPAIGPTEVVPLAFPTVSRADVGLLVAVTSRVLAPDAPDDVADTLAEKAATRARTVTVTGPEEVERLRSEMLRVLALIRADHSDDLDALARLCPPCTASLRGGVKPRQEMVGLTDMEASAYGRVVDRCLAAWRPGDPLARFLYTGE
jgi:hypothetical protein